MVSFSSFVLRHIRPRRHVERQTTQFKANGEQPAEEIGSSQIQQGQSTEQNQFSRSRSASLPRIFPSSGFELFDRSVKLEEEHFPWYSSKKFYGARIGEILHRTYQVIVKLGFGTASTTWLCRDLQEENPTWTCYLACRSLETAQKSPLRHCKDIRSRAETAQARGCGFSSHQLSYRRLSSLPAPGGSEYPDAARSVHDIEP
ncbi:hypothetical protein VTK73DRAFT_6056 [Phialemonium thermophilum]|uniref:Uncharacterized protein n=1 Tax=Phialemonium thermophilum TaxID=223376 RepID=A0ABR3XX95_9PEZI